MYYYVNHQAINESFKPLEVETDPIVRLELINSIQPEIVERLVNQIGLTAYELKLKDWSTGQIAEAFGLSERKIKALIRLHAKRTNSHNPLARYEALNVVDISHLVQKGVGSASLQNPTPPLP
jgi:hypothetical protein